MTGTHEGISKNHTHGAAHAPSHPLILEVHTRWWLAHLPPLPNGHPPSLATLPDAELDRLQALGISHLWLMGIWQTGPRAASASRRSPALQQAATGLASLPNHPPFQVEASPYAIRDYTVADEFGGDDALAILRERLHRRRIRLILDFVPNHVGLDHPWTQEHPEWLMPASPGSPDGIELHGCWFAHGKDPYFPPWCDTLQVNFHHPAARAAITDALVRVLERCDGVRCDMAMLVLDEVFARTWPRPALSPPSTPGPSAEFWATALGRARSRFPEALLIAEAYWDLEPRLVELGFHHAYDKTWYDRLREGQPRAALEWLHAQTQPQSGLRFLENHDEPRAASLFPEPLALPALTLLLALPGARLLHQGQLEGARVKAPIQLNRCPPEPGNTPLQTLHTRLIQTLRQSSIGRGPWQWAAPLDASDATAIQWFGDPATLVAVNLGPKPARIQLATPLDPCRLHPRLDAPAAAGTRILPRSAANQPMELFLPPFGCQIWTEAPV